jgi:hypothetical protein
VGSYDTPDNAQRVFVAGDYAFVADLTTGLLVIDISDPTTPTLAGSYNTTGNAKDVCVSGDYAFVADDLDGLAVIDISDPTTPTLAGSYNTMGNAWGVSVEGDYAFVGGYSTGLQVIDISDPTTPTLAGTYNTSGNSMGVYISGDYAFVADYGDGLKVINISDPTTPTLAGSYNTSGFSRRVSIAGDHAYLADSGSGLQVIDISDPTTPTLAGAYNTTGSALDVYVSGDRAFVADGVSGLQLIDITDPAAPALTETIASPGVAIGVYPAGEHAFVADGASGLQVFQAVNLITPQRVGSYDTPLSARGLDVSGDLALVADWFTLELVDISDPSQPTLTGSYAYSEVSDVDVSGNLACVAVGNGGMKILDISDPSLPTQVGAYNGEGICMDVEVAGDYAFTANSIFMGGPGFQVIDISDPTTPVLAGGYHPGSIGTVFLEGNYAYCAGGTFGFYVIDISDPTTPVLGGSYSHSGSTQDVVVSGNHAYMVDSQNLLFGIVDVSDPTNPVSTGSASTLGPSLAVGVRGDFAFVAIDTLGIQVFDVSDPTAPVSVHSIDLPGQTRGLALRGDLVLSVGYDTGLDITNVFSGEVLASTGVAQSLVVTTASDTIRQARLTAAQADSVAWELSADGGTNWRSVMSDGSWHWFPEPGVDLVWRNTLLWTTASNPIVSDLDIEWLRDFAEIVSVDDMPADQGGWVRVSFQRSQRDDPSGGSLLVQDYGIWRRSDVPALPAEVDGKAFGAIPIYTAGDRKFVRGGPDAAMAAAAFPPGTWDWVATVPALQQDTYTAIIPTAADSSSAGTNHIVLVVTAHTIDPLTWYISAPDSGYSLDNIAPAVPANFAVAYNTGGGNALSWDPCPDDDFQYFQVYRSSDPGFTPSPATQVHSTTSTGWNDPEYDGWPVYYKVTALDDADNESDPASAGTATGIVESTAPQVHALYQNVPNPFNPSTVICYDVPVGGGVVSLRIYDVGGRLVRTLVDGIEEPGEKRVTWSGRNDLGSRVATGVYFYRMTAPGYELTKKMVLLQ